MHQTGFAVRERRDEPEPLQQAHASSVHRSGTAANWNWPIASPPQSRPTLINRSISARAPPAPRRGLPPRPVGKGQLAETHVAMIHLQHVIRNDHAADQDVEHSPPPLLGEPWDHAAKPHGPQQFPDLASLIGDRVGRFVRAIARAAGSERFTALARSQNVANEAPLRREVVASSSGLFALQDDRRDSPAQFRWMAAARPSSRAVNGARGERSGILSELQSMSSGVCDARVLGKQRRHSPWPGCVNRPCIEGV